MEKVKRRVFFWGLAGLFMVTAPLVVFYATGFRFDINRGVFVHSGTITLKTNPQNVDIYINGELEKSKKINRINNYYNITGLLPKEYDVRVIADGFQSWNKKIDVHSGISSEFWNILLVRSDYEKTAFETAGIDKFFISPKNKNLAYTRDSDSGVGVGILDIDNKTTVNAFSFPGWRFLNKSQKENIEWSPEENYLSVPLEKPIQQPVPKKNRLSIEEKIERAYLILNPKTNDYFNLNQFLNKDDIRKVRWDPKDKDFLFFLSKGSLYRASIKNVNDMMLIADNVSSFELSKTNVYYSESPNELVYKTSLDGKSEKIQITTGFPEFPSAPIDQLIVYDDSRIAFINKNKELFIYNKGNRDNYFKKLGANIEGIQFSDDGKKLLFWTANEISAYFLRDWEVQPRRSENESANITRYGENLKNVQWFKDYEHVIFTVSNQIKIIELDPRDHRDSVDILETSLKDNFTIYNHSESKLFFIDKKDEAPALYSINFPEKNNILGL